MDGSCRLLPNHKPSFFISGHNYSNGWDLFFSPFHLCSYSENGKTPEIDLGILKSYNIRMLPEVVIQFFDEPLTEKPLQFGEFPDSAPPYVEDNLKRYPWENVFTVSIGVPN